MSRSLLYAVLIQGLGAALAILTVLGISRFFGPIEQGVFALYKNWYEISSIALLLGLPQGIIYAVNKQHISAAFAQRLALYHTLLALVPVFILSVVQERYHYLPLSHLPLGSLAMTIGICGYIYHGIARNIVLTLNDGLEFSLLAVAPTVGVIPLVLVQSILHRWDVATIFALNGAACGLVAWAILLRRDLGAISAKPGWPSVLARQSSHFLLQSLLFALQPFAAYYLLRRSAGGVHDVGIFSFALIALVAVNSLIAMVAPILVNRWSKLDEAHAVRQLSGALLKLACIIGFPTTLLMWLLAPIATLLVGEKFAEAIPLIRLLSIACVPLIFTRLAQPALMALGRADTGTLIGFTRVAAMIGTVLLFGNMFAAITGIVCAWAVAEFAAAALLLILLRRSRRRDLEPVALPASEI